MAEPEILAGGAAGVRELLPRVREHEGAAAGHLCLKRRGSREQPLGSLLGWGMGHQAPATGRTVVHGPPPPGGVRPACSKIGHRRKIISYI